MSKRYMDAVDLLKKLSEHTLHYSDQEQAADVVRGLLARIPDASADRLYRAINGLDGDDADQRAEWFIASTIDGWIPSQARCQVKLALAQNFEELYQRAARAALNR